MSYEQIAKDPEMSGFILSAGKSLFADNCAPCHQAGGQGVIGFFPNLTMTTGCMAVRSTRFIRR